MNWNKNEFDLIVDVYFLFCDCNFKCCITQLPIWNSCNWTSSISRIWKRPLWFPVWALAPKTKLWNAKTNVQPAKTRFCKWQSARLWPLPFGINLKYCFFPSKLIVEVPFWLRFLKGKFGNHNTNFFLDITNT